MAAMIQNGVVDFGRIAIDELDFEQKDPGVLGIEHNASSLETSSVFTKKNTEKRLYKAQGHQRPVRSSRPKMQSHFADRAPVYYRD